MNRRIVATAVSRVSAFALAILAGAAPADPLGRELYVEPSPLHALIDALPRMPIEARLDLAGIIIEGLAAAYETELDQALLDLDRRGVGQRELTRWYQATAPILAELRAWQAALYMAQDVRVHIERHNQLLLLIDGRPLWIAWPRASAQAGLERQLAAEFCSRHACPGVEAGDERGMEHGEDAMVQAADKPSLQGTWTLSQLRPPTWESSEGVNCEFADYSAIGAKEKLCRDLVADLQVLAAALREAVRRGERIEWRQLGIRAGPVGAQHRITVNQAGDYVAVYVPALAGREVDWPEAQRWLEARMDGRSVSATVLRAAAGG
jgi:hypothetical protein